MANVIQRSFTGGEITPSLYARVDQVKYQTGLHTCRNFMVQRHGGAANRPGTDYVVTEKLPSTPLRILPFIYSTSLETQNYLLQFGDRYLRFVQLGGQVMLGLVPYEIVSPYAAADIARLKYVQSADVMTITHPNYPIYELRRYGHTNWTLTIQTVGPDIHGPTGLLLTGGIVGPLIYYAVTAISETTGEESLASVTSLVDRVPDTATPTVVTWDLVTGASDYNIYRSTDGITYGYVGPFGGSTTEKTNDVWVTDVQSAVIVGSAGVWTPAAGQVRMNVLAVVGDKPYNGQFTVHGKFAAYGAGPTAVFADGRVRAYYKRNTDGARVDAGIIYTGSDVFPAVAFTALVTVPDDGYTTLQIDLVPEVLDDGAAGGDPAYQYTCSLDFTVVGTDYISWARGSTGTLSFKDDDILPDLLHRPPTQAPLFNGLNKWPAVVGRFQQRLLLASTLELPEKVWGSRIGNYHNFSKSFPLADDDSFAFTLAGEEVNEVRHLIGLSKLLMFTSGGVWSMNGNDSGTLTPTAINPVQVSATGSSHLRPIKVLNTALFVQARGTIVRDILEDVVEGYKGRDLTLFATHLFDPYTIESWAFQEIPHSIIWVARSDGSLLGLTYIREHEIVGWHRHDTDGVIEQVCVIPESNEDKLYLVVRRTINGMLVRYIERMASRAMLDIYDAHFLDCALAYDGENFDPAKTMTLTTGGGWTYGDLLTITANTPGSFIANDAGNVIVLVAADGREVRFLLENWTDGQHMTGHVDVDAVPVDLRATATMNWMKAVDQVAGLGHLEGKAVGIFAEGLVIGNPYRDELQPFVVTAGSVTLPRAYWKILVGLPYLSDLQTLDLDTASASTVKDKRSLVNKVTVMIESSRGLWAGMREPVTDAKDGLQELLSRDLEDDYNLPALLTETVDITIESTWNNNGRVFIRQLDPLPLAVLSIAPSGYLTTGG